jgi:DNA ligase D-like protein (predicted ligase)
MARAQASSTQQRRLANTSRIAAPDIEEAEHFILCEACQQLVDRRKLGDVLHHDEPGHEPLAPEEPLRFTSLMHPSLAAAPPENDQWQHEIKYDGYRTQIVIQGGSVRAYTRNGHDWTERYRPLVQAAAQLGCSSAILDGEVIVQDEQGRPDFGALREAIHRRPQSLVFMAFDLLHWDGRDLRIDPLEERRESLRRLVGCHDPSCSIQTSEHVIGNGAAMLAAADQMGLEGIVSKKRTSRYRGGRSASWPKVKCFAEGEFVLIGTERGDKAPTALLARETEHGLEYAGSAMVTLAEPERSYFWHQVEGLRQERPVLPMKNKAATWVRPTLRLRARYLKGEEMLRHATVKQVLEPVG